MPENKKSSRYRITIVLTLLLVFMLITLALPPVTELEALPAESHSLDGVAGSNAGTGLANCRYGTSSGEKHVSYGLVDNIGSGVFYKFDNPYWWGPLPENGAERLLMINIKQKKTSTGEYLPAYKTGVPLDQDLVNFIRANTGAVWLLGNEIERGPNSDKILTSQGDIFPDIYAEAYHDVYYFIKGVDPTARIAIAGLIQATPMRLQYLDHLWAAYQDKYGKPMPVDVWNIHLYVLPELTPEGEPNDIASAALGTDLSLGKRGSGRDASLCPDPNVYCFSEHDDISIITEQMLAMRQWMKDHGQQDKPLIVSEFSTLYHLKFNEDGSCKGIKDENGECFLPDRVSKYLTETFDLFNNTRDQNLGYALDNNRLVQQWIWFHMRWEYSTSDLLVYDTPVLSPIGETFRDYVHAEDVKVNLLVEDVSAAVSQNADGTYDAELTAVYRNNGNVAVDEPFLISFYKDEDHTKLIGSVVVNDAIRGCATGSYTATVTWPSLPEGTYRFWVKLDSKSAVYEGSAEHDNFGTAAIVADKSAPIYVLDAQVAGAAADQGGIIRKEPNAQKYAQDEVVKLTAIPYTGWRFTSWTGDVNSTDSTIDVTMDGDKTIWANFSPEQYQINTTVTGKGSIVAVPTKESYTYGEYVSLNAVPSEGWRFGSWGGAADGEQPSIWIKLEEDVVVTANFVQILPNVVDQAFLPINARP